MNEEFISVGNLWIELKEKKLAILSKYFVYRLWWILVEPNQAAPVCHSDTQLFSRTQKHKIDGWTHFSTPHPEMIRIVIE